MATTFGIIPQYTAGIESFTIFWRAPGTTVWNNYEIGSRVSVGYEIRFTPVPYQNFTLDTESAYYISQYGERVDITLTEDAVTGAWTFTMPLASVYINKSCRLFCSN